MQMSHYILLLQVSTPFSLPGGQQIPAKGRVQTLIGSQCRTRLMSNLGWWESQYSSKQCVMLLCLLKLRILTIKERALLSDAKINQ